MKKTTKLLFSLASTLLMATGCQLAPTTSSPVESTPVTGESSTVVEQTAEEKVQEAYNLLVYSGLTKVTDNFNLIQSISGLEDVKITYSVAESAANYLAVEGTVMKVTRPTFEEGSKQFTPGFTATLTLGDVVKTKNFNVGIEALPEQKEGLTLVTNPVANTNYKLGFTNATATLFFNGEMSSFYGATATHPYNGADVQLKETTGGYHLTFVDKAGKTQYIYVAISSNENGVHTNFLFAETPAEDGGVWTYDAANNTVVTTVGGERHWLGANGTYATLDAYNDQEKEDKAIFMAHFFTYTGEAPEAPKHPEFATEISTEKEYNLGMIIADDKLVYFTGTMNGYYGATSETRTEAVAAHVEATTGGYHLAFTKGTEKKYINLVSSFDEAANKTYNNFKIQDTATSVFTWDAEYDTLITKNGNGEDFFMGTFGANKTVSFSAYKYLAQGNYVLRFYETGNTITPENPGTETPDTPVTPDPETPVDPETPAPETPTAITTIAGALAAKEGDAVVLEGTVSKIYQAWSDQHSNISFYITDGTDTILIFRTGTKANIGDKVKVEGKVTIYNSTAQIAQGATTTILEAHTCSSFTDATCLDAAKCTVCGKEGTAALGHTSANAEGNCDRCGANIAEAAKTINVTKTAAELATMYSWENSKKYTTFKLDDNITVSTVPNGSNSGKYYTLNGGSWRLYSSEKAYIKFEAATGYKILDVKVTYSEGGISGLASGTTVNVNNTTVSYDCTAKTFVTTITVSYVAI